MNVIEIKNGVQVNRKFDKVKVQGFFQSAEMLENVLGLRYLLKCQTRTKQLLCFSSSLTLPTSPIKLTNESIPNSLASSLRLFSSDPFPHIFSSYFGCFL